MEKPYGGPQSFKFDNEMRLQVQEFLDDNVHLTVHELNAKLRLELPNKPNVHYKTFSNAIDGLAFTLKFSRDSQQDRDSAKTKAWRKEYCEWLMSAEVGNVMKIYIDEFGCNIYTKRIFGRSKKGESAYRTIASESGVNITVWAAFCAELGMVYYQTYSGGMKKDLFVNFLEAVSANVMAEFGTTVCAYLIFDNAPSHRNVEEATAIGTFPTKHLPKCSPFLNPLLNAFSAWKASLEALLSANQHVFLSPNENGREIGQSMCNF